MDRYEVLIIVRNIFLRSFFIGFLFLVVAALLYMPCKCLVASIYQSGIGISAETYYDMWVSFVGLIKTILVFLFLTPALAIHFTALEYKKKHSI